MSVPVTADSADRCSYVLSRCSGCAGRPVMGHSVSRAGSYQAMRCREVGATGRQIDRRTTGWCQAVIGPGPPLQISAGKVSVDLACHVALENADDLALRGPFGEAALEVVAGAWLGAEAGEHEPPQRLGRVAGFAPRDAHGGGFSPL